MIDPKSARQAACDLTHSAIDAAAAGLLDICFRLLCGVLEPVVVPDFDDWDLWEIECEVTA